MKRIFDNAVNPSKTADLQAKALERRILMASKGADGDESVVGGHKAKGAVKYGNSLFANKKKAAETYFDIIQMQAQLRSELNTMMVDLGKLGDQLHAIDLRMAKRQADIDFITRDIHDEDDLINANGDYNLRVKTLLDKHGKGDLPPDEAYLFITGTLTQQLFDAQDTDQTQRDDVADRFDQKQSQIQDKIEQGRDLGMDMTEYERQEAQTSKFVSTSIERAVVAAAEIDEVFEIASNEGLEGTDFCSTTL